MPSRYRKTAADGDKYGHHHRIARGREGANVRAGNGYCAEPICLWPTRWIPPDSPWDLAHDPTGKRVIGPAHRRCNRAEGATRGNRLRHQPARRVTRTWG